MADTFNWGWKPAIIPCCLPPKTRTKPSRRVTKPLQLGHALTADGRWRLIAFAPSGDQGQSKAAIATLCNSLSLGLFARYTPANIDIDSVFDLRAVFQNAHQNMGFIPTKVPNPPQDLTMLEAHLSGQVAAA